MQRILIYCAYESNRLRYVLDIIFDQLLGISYELTSNLSHFQASDSLKINYSQKNLANSIHIYPTTLLIEWGVRPIDIHSGKWNDIPVIFITQENASIPFDIFAAVFYMVSRYEEYLPYEADIHGRFNATSSLAYRLGFLEEPIVQQWCNRLLQKLIEQDCSVPYQIPRFRIEPTIDVDVAFAFLYRDLKRTLGSTFRDLLYFRWSHLLRRLLIATSFRPDPFDSYDFITKIHQKFNCEPVIFYLARNYGPYDKNISLSHPVAGYLLQYLYEHHQIGIHPSYNSFDQPAELEQEIFRMTEIIKAPIVNSRQHYLRLKMPGTYRNLISLGIRHDYSLGFHDKPGFRAGIAAPYPFYDLEHDEKTSLILHPFVFMERVLKDRLQLDPDAALMIISDLMKKVIAVNGTFGTLWHNDSLSDFGEWKGWRQVYEIMLSMASGAATFYAQEELDDLDIDLGK